MTVIGLRRVLNSDNQDIEHAIRQITGQDVEYQQTSPYGGDNDILQSFADTKTLILLSYFGGKILDKVADITIGNAIESAYKKWKRGLKLRGYEDPKLLIREDDFEESLTSLLSALDKKSEAGFAIEFGAPLPDPAYQNREAARPLRFTSTDPKITVEKFITECKLMAMISERVDAFSANFKSEFPEGPLIATPESRDLLFRYHMSSNFGVANLEIEISDEGILSEKINTFQYFK